MDACMLLFWEKSKLEIILREGCMHEEFVGLKKSFACMCVSLEIDKT
jgi:hypothetical protein